MANTDINHFVLPQPVIQHSNQTKTEMVAQLSPSGLDHDVVIDRAQQSAHHSSDIGYKKTQHRPLKQRKMQQQSEVR